MNRLKLRNKYKILHEDLLKYFVRNKLFLFRNVSITLDTLHTTKKVLKRLHKNDFIFNHLNVNKQVFFHYFIFWLSILFFFISLLSSLFKKTLVKKIYH